MAAKAAGKVNAAGLQVNDRIIVKIVRNDAGLMTHMHESATKTGEDVLVARVVAKSAHMIFTGRRQSRRYVIETTAGTFEAAPIQTMWLAPEDNAGVKRAHVEALAEDRERELAVHEALAAELAFNEVHEQEDTVGINLDELPDPDGSNELPVPAEYFGELEQFTAAEREALAEDFRTSGALDDNHVEALIEDAERAAAGETPLEAEQRHLDEAAQAPTVTGDMSGSAVVELMETVWSRIRENHTELPAVVIVTGSGLIGGSKWGHFRRDGWKIQSEGAATSGHLDEMFMAGETLAKGARQVLQTMLHEGAHTLAKVRGVQDTSRQNRWHNAKFKELATEMGLEYRATAADKSIGYSDVRLTDTTAERYADLLTELDAAIRLVCHLPAWLGGSDEDGGEHIAKRPRTTEPSTGNLKLTCKCDEPIIIRASRKVADLNIIRCDECESLFADRS